MLSFPRDLRAEIVCPGEATYTHEDQRRVRGLRLDAARSRPCASSPACPINYLITVNFRGFTQVVDKLGGIWMDVDRRYFNTRSGQYGYATINLQPGYQQLDGYQALDFVRFRHTDSDLYRIARQQLLRPRAQGSGPHELLAHEAAEGDQGADEQHRGRRRAAARTSAPRRCSRTPSSPTRCRRVTSSSRRIEGLEGFSDLTTSSENISEAVREFANPDVESPKKATAVALGEKVKAKAPPPKETT